MHRGPPELCEGSAVILAPLWRVRQASLRVVSLALEERADYGQAASLAAYANTPITGLALFPTVIGRPLGVMASCSIGRPAAHAIVA
ncbi:MAG: hypothetical protein QOE70_1410 [Chthoniobacter sp.]|nr:hypothetical protein [Chthoniobacter sp.]